MADANRQLLSAQRLIEAQRQAAFEKRFLSAWKKFRPQATQQQILDSLRKGPVQFRDFQQSTPSEVIGTPGPPKHPPVITLVHTVTEEAKPKSTSDLCFRKNDYLYIHMKHFGTLEDSSVEVRPEGAPKKTLHKLNPWGLTQAVDKGDLQWALVPLPIVDPVGDVLYWAPDPMRPEISMMSVQFYMKRPVIVPERWVIEVTTPSGTATRSLILLPHYTPRMISGYDYFEQEPAKRTHKQFFHDVHPGGSILRVFHDPHCKGMIPKGETTQDWFFRNKKLPQGVQLTNWMVDLINPDNAKGQWDVVWKQFIEMSTSALTQNYFDFFTGYAKLLVWVLAPLFDEKAGSYGIDYVKIPEGNDLSLGLRADTTCYSFSPMDNVTLTYVAVFNVLWPNDLPYHERPDNYFTQQEMINKAMENPAYW